MLRKFLSLYQFSLKDKAFTLGANLRVCLQQEDKNMNLLNHMFQAYLSDKIYDQQIAKDENQDIIATLIANYHNNRELMTNIVKYLETMHTASNFLTNANKLISYTQDEYISILLLCFYSSPYFTSSQYFQQYKDTLQNPTLLQDCIICLLTNQESQLTDLQLSQLKQYEGHLKPYAQLIISQFENVEDSNLLCHPRLLLVNKFKNNFVLSQILKQIDQLSLPYLQQCLSILYDYPQSELVSQILKKLYISRIEQKQTLYFYKKILKPFCNLMVKQACFNDYKVHAFLAQRIIFVNLNSSALRSIYVDLQRIQQTDKQIFTKFQQFFSLPEFAQARDKIEAHLENEIKDDQIFKIDLFQIKVSGEYFHKYLLQVKPDLKLIKSLLRVINMNSNFWKSETTKQDQYIIMNEWIKKYPGEYLSFIDLTICRSEDFIQFLINQSSIQSIFKFCNLNYQYLKTNNEHILYPSQFINYLYQESSQFITEQKSNIKDIQTLITYLKLYELIKDYDQQFLDQLQMYCQKQEQQVLYSILRACPKLRQLFPDEIPKIYKVDEQIINNSLKLSSINKLTSLDQIINANALCMQMPYQDMRKFKSQLKERLGQISEQPTVQQAYELLMGFRQNDFDDYTYLELLKMIKCKVDTFDFVHLSKLVDKLIINKQIHSTLFYKIYLKIHQVYQTQFEVNSQTPSILQLTQQLIKLVPTLEFKIVEQQNEESQFIAEIVKAICGKEHTILQFDNKWQQSYIEFYPDLRQENLNFEMTFKQQQQLAIQAYKLGLKLEINENELLKQVNQKPIRLLTQIQLGCLISMVENNEQYIRKLQDNFRKTEPSYLFQDQIIVLFNIIKKLNLGPQVASHYEIIIKEQLFDLEQPTLEYLFKESVITQRLISMIEDVCLI